LHQSEVKIINWKDKMNSSTIVRDENGNELSRRYADGWGWDYTYDAAGNLLTFRRTDGTGYDYTYDDNGNKLTRTKIFPKVKS